MNETTTQLGKGKGAEKTSWLSSATLQEGSEGGASSVTAEAGRGKVHCSLPQGLTPHQ